MRYAKINIHDIANGPGVRVSLFVQGCKRQCKGCFNSETWPYSGGYEFTELNKMQLLSACAPDYITGLSILGGEPFDQAEELTELVKEFKEMYPRKDVAIWTGYLFEELKNDTVYSQLLEVIDVLIDGPYIEELKNPGLKWRGSSNQRIIFVKEELAIPSRSK